MASVVEKGLDLNHSNEEIIAQLERILNSKLFSSSVVLSNFLRFIVEETINGKSDELKEYTIGISALGKSHDFNPRADAIVRIHAGRLRRLLRSYYIGPGKEDAIVIEVVKGSYVPMFRPQLPNNIINEVEPNKSEIASFNRDKLTLAVLPFRNLCPDNQYQFFVDGFGEELTRVFSTSPYIDVVAHYSTRKYACEVEDMRIVASHLGTHFLITGSVRRSEREIRINVGLVDALFGRQIWNKSFTHVFDNEQYIDIQDQICTEIFAVLGGSFGHIVRSALDVFKGNERLDLETLDALLFNYHQQMTHSREAHEISRKMLEQAMSVHPNNAICLSWLANIYLDGYTLGYPTAENPVKEAYRLAQKAVGLDPTYQMGHIIFAWVHVYMREREKAVELFEFCCELGPLSSSEEGTLGFGFACVGKYDRAKELLDRSLSLNPYCPWWYYLGYFFIHYHLGEYENALLDTRKMNVSDDVFFKPLLSLAAKAEIGMLEDTEAEVHALNSRFGEILDQLSVHLGSLTLDKKLVERVMDRVRLCGLDVY